jgi:NodT family efflux transporter outer membrane factor (OMF) lipoprotein
MKTIFMRVLIILITALFSACSLAPTYQRPAMKIPTHYKESGNWHTSTPEVADKTKGEWWQIFNDPLLNALEKKVTCENQNVKAAFGRYQEARAYFQIQRSYLFPTITADMDTSRIQTSGNVANKDRVPLYSDLSLQSYLTYELDVFGRIRNTVANSDYLAQASAADLASLRLSLQADLANYYFDLRAADASQRTLDTIVIEYRKQLELIVRRHKIGTAAEADVDQAQAQLENAKTIAADMRLQRSLYEHAIAVLTDQAPASFSIAPRYYKPVFVTIPSDYPSLLLERRPDIAAAEKRVQAANAYIGVARAAYFPDFHISAQLGLESATWAKLFRMPSLIWSIGPAASLSLIDPTAAYTIFDGGRIQGYLNNAKASYHVTVANYRQTVLTALQNVEDNLAAQRQLEREYQTQSAATRASKRALAQAEYRYKGGIVSYLAVVVAENIELQSELNTINVINRRQVATVQLIKALGGAWA